MSPLSHKTNLSENIDDDDDDDDIPKRRYDAAGMPQAGKL